MTLAAALALAIGGASAQRPATSFATEDSTRGWRAIDEPLARTIVADGDPSVREMLDDAIHDAGLARNYRQFFRARPVALAASGGSFLFVRPASDPWYAPLYGAHVFRFWVVGAADDILIASAADKVSLRGSVHEGMRDLVVSQCRGGDCFDTTEVFAHGKYRDGSCATTAIATGRTHAGCP